MTLRTKLCVFFLAFGIMGTSASFAADQLRIILFLGTNSVPPSDARLAGEKMHQRLKEVFGFKHYELLKEENHALRDEWEQWFVPRKDFFMRLEPLRPREPGGARMVDYEIYKDGFIVAKGKYEVRENIPLFINGPDFHQGRFIFVLEAK